jgi:hypothetical protein
MDNFLDRIDGLSSENLTTEVLGFLLDSSAYAPYQRLFYSLIFPGSELQDTEEHNFDITTQMSFEEYGRPDIVIENERQVIFIENKFYASFSLDNQMYRYYCYLKDNFENKEKYLILLTIKDRIDLYLRDIRKQFKTVLTTSSNHEVLNYCSDNGVILQTISWEDIFRLFGNKDFLITNLNSYIQSKYITSTILNEREIEMINSKEVPILMEKLWAGIDKIRDMLAGDNYKVLRASQSKIFYGFAVERFWGKVYVEHYHYSWLNYGTPYMMQIRLDWVDSNYRAIDLETQLKSIDFIYDKNMEYVLPIVIKEADLAGSAVEVIKDKLKQLDDMFEQLKA